MLPFQNLDLSLHYGFVFLTCPYAVFCGLSTATSGRAYRPVDWLCALSVGSRGRARRSLPKHGTRTSTIFMGDSPPWANLASFPPIGGTPTGFRRASALGTVKREAGSGGGASPYPRSLALLPVSGRSNRARARYRARSSIVLGDLVKRDGNGKKEHEHEES
jgi:hypothetical protein